MIDGVAFGSCASRDKVNSTSGLCPRFLEALDRVLAVQVKQLSRHNRVSYGFAPLGHLLSGELLMLNESTRNSPPKFLLKIPI